MALEILEAFESSLNDIWENFRFDTWWAIFFCTFFWGLLYITIQAKLHEESPEYCSRLVTLIHGFVVAFFGVTECFGEKWPFDHPELETTNLQTLIMVASLGYFFVDLSWCLYYQSESALIIIHHIYSCVALIRTIFKGSSGAQVTCALGGLEVTNPLLQARWFIRTHGYKDTPLFTSVEFTFIITFFLVRILIGSYLLPGVILNPKNDSEFIVFTVLIYIMSWTFMINISKYLYYKYLKGNVEEHLPQTGTG